MAMRAFEEWMVLAGSGEHVGLLVLRILSYIGPGIAASMFQDGQGRLELLDHSAFVPPN